VPNTALAGENTAIAAENTALAAENIAAGSADDGAVVDSTSTRFEEMYQRESTRDRNRGESTI